MAVALILENGEGCGGGSQAWGIGLGNLCHPAIILDSEIIVGNYVGSTERIWFRVKVRVRVLGQLSLSSITLKAFPFPAFTGLSLYLGEPVTNVHCACIERLGNSLLIRSSLCRKTGHRERQLVAFLCNVEHEANSSKAQRNKAGLESVKTLSTRPVTRS